MSYRRLWIALGLVLVISFAVLGGVGVKVMSNAPPIPSQVVTADGRVLFDSATVQDGQGAWQSIGGQEVGTIWGHGSYIAPDWTADWLHRECVFILDRWAVEAGAANYAVLPAETQAALRARLEIVIRQNRYDAGTGRIVVDPVRAAAFDELEKYYADVFLDSQRTNTKMRSADRK